MRALVSLLVLLLYAFAGVSSAKRPSSLLLHPEVHPIFSMALRKLPKPARAILAESLQQRDIASVDARHLLQCLPISKAHRDAAAKALSRPVEQVVETVDHVLTAEECLKLRAWAEERMDPGLADSVDGAPEYQVDCDENTLGDLVGHDAVDRICSLAERWMGGQPADEIGIFVRKYAAGGRPYIPFHVDTTDVTVNICLSEPEEHAGGDLLVLAGKKLRSIERQMGSATCHVWYCCHGVQGVTSGERWSLLMFFLNSKASR
uniref:Fe2OG dioxygenase domain-containing protein n=1 Tax=Pinguiococcus pyrenoidosus TaxID=172671 RepID=A0A7R9U5J9_9STRA|mmetsp:Transcript_149/g.643  ORF Transcript_149/g.643 Transcript_149/m.643 type:complete len:262 (+) Transcript_149:150-935(+)